MNIITLLFFLLWLFSGYLVFDFVVHTPGGHLAKVFHYFGGTFVIIGLAIGIVWIFSRLDTDFGTRVNVYLATHQVRQKNAEPMIQRHAENNLVTVYRLGAVNNFGQVNGGKVMLDEHYTVRTSLWWMLWDSRYHP